MNKKIITVILCTFLSFGTSLSAKSKNKVITYNKNKSNQKPQPGSIILQPPKDWSLADKDSLDDNIELMVIGKGKHDFPPSINVATERFPGTLKDYLKIVKQINDEQGTNWKDLGKFQTKAGVASLSQFDSKTEWGDVRMMHMILKHDNKIIILTAAALKEEFANFYKDFFSTMRSFDISK